MVWGRYFWAKKKNLPFSYQAFYYEKLSNIQKNCKNCPVNTQSPHLDSIINILLYLLIHISIYLSLSLSTHHLFWF